MKIPPALGLNAIEKVLRAALEDYGTPPGVTDDECRDAWLTWQDVRATVEVMEA